MLSNKGEDGGFAAFYRRRLEHSTAATWLRGEGYRTALLGKYFNGYSKGADANHVPPGWDEWAALRPSGYFGYTLVENGRAVSYGNRPEDYSTDVLARKAADFVTQTAADDRPFFLYLAPFAPHAPATPAPRHAKSFAGERAPRPPSFNEADVSDKPRWVQNQPRLTKRQVAALDERYRQRLRSLLAVDDMVARLIDTLRDSGTLDDTYIFFASDNGFHQGEHRIPDGKSTPYEESVRVPLIVRGPGVPAGREEGRLALNIDLAPTFAKLAGVEPPSFVDGRSLVPLLRGDPPGAWRQVALLERFSDAPSQQFKALRTDGSLYAEYPSGQRELYDLREDPFQLENRAATADPALLTQLASRLDKLMQCAAAKCRGLEDEPLG